MTSPQKLKVSGEVRELIRHLHPKLKRKVRTSLSEIIKNPSCGKSLRGELQGMRSLRVGKIRIIYRQIINSIELIAIGPRRSIYKETLRILQKENRK